jgi:low affinity Fe/Cu permease
MDWQWFDRLSKGAARVAGRPASFVAVLALIAGWLATGSWFGFSDSWQLFINTATTLLTVLMVFLIQNTQNRDTEAIQIKLDELIRATEAASNTLLDLEELDERTLDRYRARYESLARQARDQAGDALPEHQTAKRTRRLVP